MYSLLLDIALIKIPDSLSFRFGTGTNLKPIRWNKFSESRKFIGGCLVVSGWGNTELIPQTITKLMVAEILLVENGKMDEHGVIDKGADLDHDLIIRGNPQIHKKWTCRGDSGGTE